MINNLILQVINKIFYEKKIFKKFLSVQILSFLSSILQISTLLLISLFVKNIIDNQNYNLHILGLSITLDSNQINYLFLFVFFASSLLHLLSLKKTVDLSQYIAAFLREKLFRFYLEKKKGRCRWQVLWRSSALSRGFRQY